MERGDWGILKPGGIRKWGFVRKEATTLKLDRDNAYLGLFSLHSPMPVQSSASPAMSTANKEVQSSSDLPVRQGALSAEQIHDECPQFHILIIGKANAGKTTILRKVCNAKPDAKPIVYDAEGKKVPTKVRLENLGVRTKN